MAESNNGFTGANVIIRVVNTNIPDVCEQEEHFVITGTHATQNGWSLLWVLTLALLDDSR